METEDKLVFPIRQTGMGAFTLPVPIDNSVRVREYWGRTHGEAVVTGNGRFLLVDVSNLGNHNCILYSKKGKELTVLDKVQHAKWCRLCDQFGMHQ